MSGREPSVRMDYASYLRLPEILAAQSPRSEPEQPGELHFIVTHQAIELWFKVVLNEITSARDVIGHDQFADATDMIGRASAIVDGTITQLRTLRWLPAQAFHRFRSYLGTASGLQSVQFREIEIRSGMRPPDVDAHLHAIFPHGVPEALRAAVAEPGLADAHRDAAARRGIEDWAEFLADPLRDPAFHGLTRALIDYDDTWRRWRGEHVAMVLRLLGSGVLGTAGTDSSYLTRRIEAQFFPYLSTPGPPGVGEDGR